MSHFQITGGAPLEGALPVHGAKNSVLPILAACLLAGALAGLASANAPTYETTFCSPMTPTTLPPHAG